MMRFETISTQMGPFSIVADNDVVIGATFDSDVSRLFERLQIEDARKGVEPRLLDCIRAYFGGDTHAIDKIEVRQSGTELRKRMWKELRAVPAGSTATYAEIAERAGAPGAARAAGTACSTNMIPLVVPCHRIVGSTGLGGYYYGLDLKRALLTHEHNSA